MAEHTRIVSSTPQRTRIRVSRKRRTPEEMARLAAGLQASPQVSEVCTNLYAGTLIVHHKERADISAELKDLGVIAMAATGFETSAMPLTEAVVDLQNQVGPALGSILDLKLLVPLGFGALAVLQIARRGLEIGGAPWYLLAYFALESFVKLNGLEQRRECEAPEAGAQR
ncbi:MAG: hypothetical protein ACP5IL_03710 [Syntrophobacteraceae bacterium]